MAKNLSRNLENLSPSPSPADRGGGFRKYRSAQLLVQWIIGALLLALFLRTWLLMGLVDPVIVAGSSMEPTLRGGQRLWIDRTAFRHRQPRRWEVVVARAPHDATELCVKRVVGLPGESVELGNGDIWINGEIAVMPLELEGPPAQPRTARNMAPVRLGLDEYFLLGDNGPISLDSRSWGPLPARLLLGKPIGVR